MTLLTICQAVAAQMNLIRPTQIFGNDDAEAQKMLSFANDVGDDLVSRGSWQALTVRTTYLTAQTVYQSIGSGDELQLETGGPLLLEGSPTENPIPDDFDRFVAETFWDESSSRFIVGPTQPVDWESLLASRYCGVQRYWTRRGNLLLVYPAFQGGETASYQYISKNFCQSATGTAQSEWAADTDIPVLPARLFTMGIVARMAASEGDVTAAVAIGAYERRVAQELKNDKPTARVMTSDPLFGSRRHSGGAPAPDSGYWPYGWGGWP